MVKLLLGFPAAEIWLCVLAGLLRPQRRSVSLALYVAALCLAIARVIATATFSSGYPVMYVGATATIVALALRFNLPSRHTLVFLPVVVLLGFEHFYARVTHQVHVVCTWTAIEKEADGVLLNCDGPQPLQLSVYSEEVKRLLVAKSVDVADTVLETTYVWGVLENLDLLAMGDTGFNRPYRYQHWSDPENRFRYRWLFF